MIFFWHSRFLNTSVNLPTSTQDAHTNVDICRYRSPTRQIEVTVIDFSFSISFVRFYQYLQLHVTLDVNYHQQPRWGRRLGWLGCVCIQMSIQTVTVYSLVCGLQLNRASQRSEIDNFLALMLQKFLHAQVCHFVKWWHELLQSSLPPCCNDVECIQEGPSFIHS